MSLNIDWIAASAFTKRRGRNGLNRHIHFHATDLNIRENVILAPLTTLEVGGPARYFVRCETETDVNDAFDFARTKNVPVFVLGGGSNIVVSDTGFDGLVVQIALKGVSIDGGLVVASAGENWDSLVAECVEKNLAGIECLSGIPGNVGGTPVQNVGAYGQEVSETIVSVRCYDRTTHSIVELSGADCGFAYRTSIFNTTERDRYVVLSVAYSLTGNGPPKIVYKDLIEHFAGQTPTLAETRDAVRSIRRSKSMVIETDDENRRSVGSFFKNPVVDREKFEQIAGQSHSPVPHFPAADEMLKIPAAWLIEHAGFHKGYRRGHAGISTRHTLAIVNRGGATANEIVSLKDEIRQVVNAKFGIDLVPEPIFVGSFDAKN
jgi:UDP-N-acetylmuramate dehydrogenase